MLKRGLPRASSVINVQPQTALRGVFPFKAHSVQDPRPLRDRDSLVCLPGQDWDGPGSERGHQDRLCSSHSPDLCPPGWDIEGLLVPYPLAASGPRFEAPIMKAPGWLPLLLVGGDSPMGLMKMSEMQQRLEDGRTEIAPGCDPW